MTHLRFLLVFALLVGCGDDSTTPMDAAGLDTTAEDAPAPEDGGLADGALTDAVAVDAVAVDAVAVDVNIVQDATSDAPPPGAVPLACTGDCPAFRSADLLTVLADGLWTLDSVYIDVSGSFAIVGRYSGSIDFGSGPLVPAEAGESRRFVVAYDFTRTLQFALQLGGGHAALTANDTQPSPLTQVAIDARGDVTVLVDLMGPVMIGGVEYTSRGGSDVLLASFDTLGEPRFVHALGGPGEDHAGELNGTTILTFTAQFSDGADFGDGALTSVGGLDAIVAHYANGVHEWSHAIGSAADDIAYGSAYHGNSREVTVAGGAGDGVDFGEGPVASAGGLDSFVARYRVSDGQLRWVQVRGGAGDDYVHQLSVDRREDLVIGDFVGSEGEEVAYGDTTVTGPAWTMANIRGVETVRWARAFDVLTDVSSLSVDIAGRPFIAGRVRGVVDLGGGALEPAGGDDMVIASYGTRGAHEWSVRIGSTGDDPPPFVSRDGSGALVIIGMMLADLDLGEQQLMSGGERSLFIARTEPR